MERITDRKRYIVIVDDEHRIVRSLVRELGAWASARGFAITGMVLGAMALEFIDEHRDEVELVVADVRMPGMSGGDMADRIKRKYPSIKIIVLTAYDDMDEDQKSRMDSFMTKPWDSDQIVREIERVLT